MKKAYSSFTIGLGILALFFSTLYFYQVNTQLNKYKKYNPAYNDYLSAFTSGEVSKHSHVKVRFATDVANETMINQAMESSPFTFKPAIAGQAVWEDARTIKFVPENKLKSGQVYLSQLDLTNILKEVPDSLQNFLFQFKAKRQHFKVDVLESTALEDKELNWHRVKGEVIANDRETPQDIEKIFAVEKDGKKLALKWLHDEKNNRHEFTIDSIARTNSQAEMLLVWNGDGIGVKHKGTEKLVIPAKGNFKTTQARSFDDEQQYILVEFSDPLDASQDLEGLVHLGEHKSDLVVDGNKVRVFPKRRLVGDAEVFVEEGIKNILGHKTQLRFQSKFTFDQLDPEVELVGKGVIIPQADKLPFAFKAVAVSAVDVRVIRIMEKNVAQFLQVNKLDGSDELKRVGTVVYRGKVDLTSTSADLRKWNTHALDLSKLINAEPGAIYEVAVGFQKEDALCDCDGEADEEDTSDPEDMLALDANWDTYVEENEDSYWDYYDDYNYRDKKNPCKNAYYHSGQVKKRNVLASDLGLIAKRGTDGRMGLIVTDIKTTKPLSGVKLEVYNYQQKLISSATTDKQGMANVPMDVRPFLLVAKQGSQRGYLRLDDGMSLSLSRFDIQGKSYTKGIKGFIYAERGVWRPGDRMYINFILEDKNKMLPAEHPVTFELTNPRGQLVKRITTAEDVNGFYSFPTATAVDAPTGNYLAKVKVGGATFSKSFKVESIMPNRLKIKFDFGKKYLTAGENINGQMEVKWLHGAIAKNLKADVEVTLTNSSTSFPKYSDFIFDDPARKFYPENKRLFKGQVDEQGLATISTNLTARKASPGKLLAKFKSKVFEPGGNFSVDRFTLPFHPYKTYVGVKTPKGDAARGMLLTDTDHQVDIVTVSPEGEAISKSNLEVKLYKLNWKWWWDKSNESLTDYKGKMYKKPIQTDNIATVNGKGSWKLRINYPAWGRYLVRVCDGETGHCTGKIVYIDWPGWAGRAQSDNPGGASMLMFTSNKKSYQVGETVSLNIPTGNAGRALVSVESGSKVLQAHWVDAVKGMTKFDFKTTPDMAPNVYVNVTLLQPHNQTKNDLPMRLYGIIPIKVEDPKTKLKPVLAMDDVLEPLQNVTVSVSESSGRPMTYTLAVVDEGLLDLTRFKTPSPWQAFYQREALKVKTWDMFDDVMGAYGAEMKNLLSIGGDGAAKAVNNTKQDRFKPVVIYLGPFKLKSGEKRSHSFQMPNYVGSVKTMVVAGDTKGAYGSVDKATPVKKPLMALASLPRVIGPGESFSLPVTIFTMEKSIQNVQVSVQGNDMINVAGLKTKNLRFTDVGEKIINFNLKARSSLGKGSVKVIAKSGGNVAVYEVDVDVRTPNPRVTDVYASAIEGNRTWQQNFTPVGMAGTNHGVLEVSSIPPLNLGKRLEYLIRYPYGCIEQTTSSGFPQVYLSTLLDLSPRQKAEVTKNIKATIDRLKGFQVSSGGFSYWPGNATADEWGTNYGGHFLLEAKEVGYNVPSVMLNNWKAFQSKKARQWNGGNRAEELTQAYRLYLLALAKSPEMGAMNRMRLKKSLNTAAKWNLAAAYYLAGQPEVAKQVSQNVSIEVANYTELSNTYGSGIRDKAIILQALSIMKDRTKAVPLVRAISDGLSSDKWMNTQATAYCLVAMGKYVGKSSTSSNMKFAYRVNGGDWQNVKSESPVWQMEMDKVSAGNVEFKNNGGGIIYSRIVLDGIPEKGDQTDAESGLALSIIYKTMSGQTIDPAEIKQGTDFKAEVTVKNTGVRGDYHELALNQIFPSGWEIHNARLDANDTYLGDKPEYQDFRDDRVYTFFDLKQGRSKKFIVLLNASYAGNFYLPTVSCEAMYDRTISARKHGTWVKVVK